MTLLENPSVFAKWDNFPAEMRGHRGRSVSLLYYVRLMSMGVNKALVVVVSPREGLVRIRRGQGQ